MSSYVENVYTFRMENNEITMRDSFASMLDTTQLTDCLLVCHSHLKDTKNEESSAGVSHLTNSHSSQTPDNTSGHQNSGRTSVDNTSNTPNSVLSAEQILRTHKVILNACSDYFRSVFSSVPNTLNNGMVSVIITNVDFDYLQAIIHFIYKGQVSVGQSRIHKFLAAAQLLMINGLMNIKLVNNDNQTIDYNSYAENELIQHLKSDNRRLKHEIRSIKETDKMEFQRMRQQIENEVKKKLEIEKNVLNEEKQRFEAQKMEFSIEKEVYEKKNESTTGIDQNQNINNSIEGSEGQHMEVEDEDREVYEVDFSQTQDDCQTSEAPKQRDLKNKESTQQITSTPCPLTQTSVLKGDSDLKEIMCPQNFCHLRFTTTYELKQHIVTHFVVPLESHLKCNECNASFKTKFRLNFHKFDIHKRLECIKCQEAFETMIALKEHTNTHLKDKNKTKFNESDYSFEAKNELSVF